jgi:hypothetical protein
MTTFDDREQAFEKKLAHDQELAFKINARRNKLLGLWAAQLLGISGADADAYAKEVVLSDYEEEGDGDVFRKVEGDMQKSGIILQPGELRAKMNALMDEAREQYMKGEKPKPEI